MAPLTPVRRAIALFTLALGGFGIGVTEFASMGLLPDIARELLPGYDADPQAVIARAGVLITAYALGVVVGAPVFAVLAARMPQAWLTFILLGLFVLGSVASAFMPTFGTLAIFRFIAALPHGAYFGVASLIAARIMGPGMQGRGVALALSGLTIANVIGVPLATWLGQTSGWRSAYVLVAAIFAVTLMLALFFLPRYPGDHTRSPMKELSALANMRVWIMVAVGAVGFGGFFAVYSYIAEVTTRETGLGEHTVPWVLACLGVGMTVGNFLGGWASDKDLTRTIMVGFTAFIISLAVYSLVAQTPVGLIISVFFIGLTSSTLIPTIQTRLIRISHESALLGAAINHAAFNVGNSLGAWLGGAVIAAGLGYRAPGWVGVILAILGLLLAITSIAVERRDKARSLNTVGLPVMGEE
ncbi:DHA1 family inner membrane transport protein [Leucobacter exalbidus]|uniref:DHA1 family inner membrane transport protein n=1 Tax=Leucobacter exalbidus TaxID=662960 RepID=A0A940PR11_9MICO|nr:MFS transporter [Leucobacter exalbidus]MBP1325168.1 DHA1 family inner membrane transport protein [Leucobacter exalbidus]